MIARHDEIKYEIGALAMLALNKSAVVDEPKTTHCRTSDTAQANSATTPTFIPSATATADTRGDLLIRGCFAKGTDLIVDIRVTDLDAASYGLTPSEKILARHEREKKSKYLKDCQYLRRHFAPLVFSADGMAAKEAKAFLQHLSAMIAKKWNKPYSQVCGYVNARMSIAIVRATHMCLRGSRIPSSQMCYRRQTWEGGAGLGLFQYN